MRPEEHAGSDPRILNDRFKLLSQLAKGGMGMTYRAWDRRTNRPAVVKIPKRALFDEPGFLERFDREVRATAGLEHPAIVKVVDHGIDGGEPFLVMQFLPGGSLAIRIAHHADRERLPLAHLHTWLPRIAAALDHAHAHGVLHRDVKPANIFFDAHGMAYLGDFGIAKILEDSVADVGDPTLTGTHIALGTHAYMAPERLAPRAVIDGRSDQYALAICAFEAMTGKKPFRGDTMNIVIEQATLPPPDLAELRPGIATAACAAVNKALAKRPGDRFSSCGEFAAAVLEGIPPPEADTGFAWLQCPACNKMSRLPKAAAGRTGRCPHCKAELVIAPGLEGLWLPSEYQPSVAAASAAVPGRFTLGPLPRGPSAVAAMLGLGLAVTALLTFLGLTHGPTRPNAVPAAANDSAASPAPGSPSPPPPPLRAEPEAPARATPAAPTMPVEIPSEAMALSAPSPVPPPEAEASPLSTVGVPPPPTPEPSAPKLEEAWRQRRDAAKAHFDEVVRWVLVADPGNAADPQTQRGAVASPFYVSQYELTNADYCVFLNASAAGRLNLDGLGDRAVAAGATPAGIRRVEADEDDGFRYEPAPAMGSKPAVVTARDALSLANWLHNIHCDGSDEISYGAYEIPADPEASPNGPRAVAAMFFIPSLDEWFKAAYFKGGKTQTGYWSYPTATNDPLVPTSGPMPAGRPDLRGVETAANFARACRWAGDPPVAAPTDVGMNGAPSAYGVFDMAGNVAEWVYVNDLSGGVMAACGGDFASKLRMLDRGFYKKLDEAFRDNAPTATGVRLMRTTRSLDVPVIPEPFARKTKAATFSARQKLLAAFTRGKNQVISLRDCSPQDVSSIARKLPDMTSVKFAEVDDGVRKAAENLAKQLEVAGELVNQRQNKIRQFVPAATAQQPVTDLLTAVVTAAAGIQAQNDLANLLDRFDAQLEPIQNEVSKEIAALIALGSTLESRYGKP